MRLWVLSNGRGEDHAAAQVAAAVRARAPACEIRAVPLLGDGHAYRACGIEVATPGARPASGGFSTAGWRVFLSDLPAVPEILRIVHWLRRRTRPGDEVVVVGDVFALLVARVAFGSVAVFLSLPKSSHHVPHTRLECLLMRRYAGVVLTRDAETAAVLARSGLAARWMGNPLMDGLESKDPIAPPGPFVAFLPGSRDEALDNLPALLDVVLGLPASVPAVFVFASWLDRARVAQAAAGAGWTLRSDRLVRASVTEPDEARLVTACWGRFNDVVHAATLVVGVAGTANEQAAGLGLVVVTCPGRGPQSSERRLREQERLLGGAAIFVDGPPGAVAGEVARLLGNAAERARRGAAGAARMGPAGAAASIGQLIVDHLACADERGRGEAGT